MHRTLHASEKDYNENTPTQIELVVHMPGYGLPTDNKGLLPWSWADQRLKKSHNYWITTVRPNGSLHNVSPHTMLVWALWQDGRFLFSDRKQVTQSAQPRNES